MVKLSRSKRQQLSTKYKVEKKVRAHDKKEKKNSKKTSAPKRKDPGIPNSFPFKEEVLREMQQRKERIIEERNEKNRLERERREAEKLARKQMTSLADLAANAESRAVIHEVEAQQAEQNAAATVDESNERSGFWKELNKVIEMSDVIVQVLDARDPNGCRSKQLENQVISAGKRLVLLLNKIDLIPKENLKAWMNYLSSYFPTKAFKAAKNVQHQTKHAHVSVLEAPEGLLQSNSTVLGAEELIELIKNYSRDSNGAKSKHSITVGIVGYPNVGKSSVINSLLRRSNAANVGAEAGITRSLQCLQLDSKVQLVDSPGVVFSKCTDASSVLRNAVKLQNVKDPQSIVENLVKRCPKDLLVRHFCLEDFEDSRQFVVAVAKKIGKLRKGGVADMESTSRYILQQWTNGKIKFFSFPPNINDSSFDEHAESRIIITGTEEESSGSMDIDG